MLRIIQDIHRRAGNVRVGSIQVFTGTITDKKATLSVHTCDMGPGGALLFLPPKKMQIQSGVVQTPYVTTPSSGHALLSR